MAIAGEVWAATRYGLSPTSAETIRLQSTNAWVHFGLRSLSQCVCIKSILIMMMVFGNIFSPTVVMSQLTHYGPAQSCKRAG